MKKNVFKKTLCILISALTACTFLCSCAADTKDNTDKNSSQKEISSSVNEITSSSQNEISSNEEKVPSDITPAIWEVTDKNGTKMTLMGSMHALTEKDYPLPSKIMEVFNNADTFALECDPSDIGLNEQSALLNNSKLPEGKTIKDVLSEKGYKGLVNEAKLLGVDINSLEQMKPWAAQNVLENARMVKSGLDASKGIDTYLLGKSKNSGKEIYQVETAKFQYELLSSASDTVFDIQFSIGESAKSADDLTNTVKKLYECWRKGDTENAFKPSGDEDESDLSAFSDEEVKALEKYNNDMLYNRNKNMVKAIKELLSQKKNVFFMVGYAHFLGEGGIIDLLKKDGYKINRVKY